MKDKILIITHTEDNECIEKVSEQINKNGGEAIRFNVDDYPLHIALSTCFENGQWETFFIIEDKKIKIDDVAAVWFRRSYNLGRGLSSVLEKKFVEPSLGEIRQTLYGMIEGLRCYHFGRLSQYRRIDSKEDQLKLAHHLGLKIPQTCITNDPEKAKAFVLSQHNGAIVKMQSGFAIVEEGVEEVVFTNVVTKDNLDDIGTLAYCPMQFQEKIEKEKELRVTIVGNKIFSFEIDSQKIESAKIDWRKEGVELIENWKPHQLPEDIENKLLKILDYYVIDYGAIDLILTPEGDYYFLEINAAGEFFWIDRLCDYKISEEIGNVLTNKSYRRGKIPY